MPESSKGDFPVGKTIDPELSICSPGAHCAHHPPKALDVLLGWILQSILIFYQSLQQKIQRLYQFCYFVKNMVCDVSTLLQALYYKTGSFKYIAMYLNDWYA